MLSVVLSYPEKAEKFFKEISNRRCIALNDLLYGVGECPYFMERLDTYMRARHQERLCDGVFNSLDQYYDIPMMDISLSPNGLRLGIKGIYTTALACDHSALKSFITVYCHEGRVVTATIEEDTMMDKKAHYYTYTDIPRRNCSAFERYKFIDKNIAMTNIQVFGNTVKVTFSDGTSTTAVCSENDAFSLETGIGICIGKKVMGNDFLGSIRRGVKFYERIQKRDAKEKKDREELERIRKNKIRKAIKHRQLRRERRINELAEAFVRAQKKREENN